MGQRRYFFKKRNAPKVRFPSNLAKRDVRSPGNKVERFHERSIARGHLFHFFRGIVAEKEDVEVLCIFFAGEVPRTNKDAREAVSDIQVGRYLASGKQKKKPGVCEFTKQLHRPCSAPSNG